MKKESLYGWFRWTVLVILLLTAIILAFLDLAVPAEEPSAPVQTPEIRFDREIAYEKDIEALQTLAQGEGAGAQQAMEHMEKLIGMHQSEWAIEEALKNGGFPEATVIVHQNAVAVMIPPEQMTEENSARILALCVSYADVRAENIRIMGY